LRISKIDRDTTWVKASFYAGGDNIADWGTQETPCPFFYTWNGSEYVFSNFIIHKLKGIGNETIQERQITGVTEQNGIIKVSIREEMNETAYIDTIALKINGKMIKPSFASQGLDRLENSDNNYLVMNKGDKIEAEIFASNNQGKIDAIMMLKISDDKKAELIVGLS
jgi:hypothetical protein